MTHLLVKDWFDAVWGPAATDKPTYCTDEEIRRATHRIALESASGTPWRPSYLLLAGAPLDKPGKLTDLAVRAKSAIGDLKSALARGGVDDLVKHLTPEGGNRLKAWFASADQIERDRYTTAVTRQMELPFFFFDASPLVVVYTRSPVGVVEVMYFTPNAKSELLWTNSYHITVSDRVFKKGPLHDAALRAP